MLRASWRLAVLRPALGALHPWQPHSALALHRLLVSTPAGDVGSAAPPEVPSLSVSEFRETVAGGASARPMGAAGVGHLELVAFWSSYGLRRENIERLTALGARFGGIWADPPTLRARLVFLGDLIPALPLKKLIAICPQALAVRPENMRAKLHALADVLPGVDVLMLMARRPALLRRSASLLQERGSVALEILPRSDMGKLIEEAPFLLELGPAELKARADALRFSYTPATIKRWKRSHAAQMMSFPASRLQRLRHVDRLNPDLRAAVPDSRFIFMRDTRYERHFVDRKRKTMPYKWKLNGKRIVETRDRTVVSEEVPRTGNLFAWTRARAAKQAISERTPSRTAARRHALVPPPPWERLPHHEHRKWRATTTLEAPQRSATGEGGGRRVTGVSQLSETPTASRAHSRPTENL